MRSKKDPVWELATRDRSSNFLHVTHSGLVSIADAHVWSRKTYNDAISALRVAFEFGFRHHPHCHNPASMLKCVRIRKRNRVIDPFRIDEAQRLIVAIRQDWADAQSNYDEFIFFTGTPAIGADSTPDFGLRRGEWNLGDSSSAVCRVPMEAIARAHVNSMVNHLRLPATSAIKAKHASPSRKRRFC